MPLDRLPEGTALVSLGVEIAPDLFYGLLKRTTQFADLPFEAFDLASEIVYSAAETLDPAVEFIDFNHLAAQMVVRLTDLP